MYLLLLLSSDSEKMVWFLIIDYHYVDCVIRFEKKVRYASRKARADVRKRVKGRFVKAGEAYDYDPLSKTMSFCKYRFKFCHLFYEIMIEVGKKLDFFWGVIVSQELHCLKCIKVEVEWSFSLKHQ